MVKKQEVAGITTTDPSEETVEEIVANNQKMIDKLQGDSVATSKPIHQRKLSQLIGEFVERAIEDPKSVNQSAHDLQIWHDAQSVEDRKQLVADTKKLIERAKLTCEWLYSQYQLMSQKDL